MQQLQSSLHALFICKNHQSKIFLKGFYIMFFMEMTWFMGACATLETLTHYLARSQEKEGLFLNMDEQSIKLPFRLLTKLDVLSKKSWSCTPLPTSFPLRPCNVPYCTGNKSNGQSWVASQTDQVFVEHTQCWRRAAVWGRLPLLKYRNQQMIESRVIADDRHGSGSQFINKPAANIRFCQHFWQANVWQDVFLYLCLVTQHIMLHPYDVKEIQAQKHRTKWITIFSDVVFIFCGCLQYANEKNVH